MEPLIPRLLAAQATTRVRRPFVTACINHYRKNHVSVETRSKQSQRHNTQQHIRCFTASSRNSLRERQATDLQEGANAQPAHKLSQKISKEEENHYEKMLEHSKESQMRSPWMREGSDKPPVARQRSAGAMTKGIYTSMSDIIATIMLTRAQANSSPRPLACSNSSSRSVPKT